MHRRPVRHRPARANGNPAVEVAVAKQHFGNAPPFASRQPGCNEGGGSRQFPACDQRPAGNEDNHHGYSLVGNPADAGQVFRVSLGQFQRARVGLQRIHEAVDHGTGFHNDIVAGADVAEALRVRLLANYHQGQVVLVRVGVFTGVACAEPCIRSPVANALPMEGSVYGVVSGLALPLRSSPALGPSCGHSSRPVSAGRS